jgi:putrescine transport system substrate-binding protein
MRCTVLQPVQAARRDRLMRWICYLVALVAAVLVGSDPGAAQGRPRVVNVYNWSDYIDPSVIDAFTRDTGITVRYDTFDSNDTLETKLLAGKSGYDVVRRPRTSWCAMESQKLDKSKLPTRQCLAGGDAELR